MPRPANGYRNAADQPIPGVHDITGRFADKSGLINWAYSQGQKGVPLYERGTLNIGTVVHRMCELDLRGASDREIDAVPHEMLSTPGDVDKAWQAFRAFLAWRTAHNVRAIAFEEALVSEELQYGGTFDCIAWVDGVRSLIDFKTTKSAGQVYLDQRVVMAAHGNLWHEQHPDMPLEAYHLITLPKDGSEPGHHAFADLGTEWHMFALQLECWRLEKGVTKKADPKRATAASAAPKPKRARKAKAPEPVTDVPRLAPPAMNGLSMAEILRANGMVPQLVEAA